MPGSGETAGKIVHVERIRAEIELSHHGDAGGGVIVASRSGKLAPRAPEGSTRYKQETTKLNWTPHSVVKGMHDERNTGVMEREFPVAGIGKCVQIKHKRHHHFSSCASVSKVVVF